MAGLDSIKNYQTGSTVEAPTQDPGLGAVEIKAPKDTGIQGKIALDPTQTENILANMQKYIDEREGFMPSLATGINKARAGLAGPSALVAFEREQMLQDKQTMDYRTQMAAYRAAQAQAANDAELYKSLTPSAGGTAPVVGGAGATTGGVPISAEQMAIEASLKTAAEKLESRRKYLATRNTEAIKLENAPGMRDVVEIWVPGEGTKQMTKAQATKFLESNPSLQAIVNGNKVPAATVLTPTTAATPSAPTGTQGQAVKIATDLGIPIISGDRDWDKQYDLYLKSKQPGYTGNPVAFPGTSKHQTGNAIDVGPLTAAQRQALTEAGFKQTVPNDKNHWELVSAPAAVARPAPTTTTPTAAAAPSAAVDQTKPLPGESKTQYDQRMKETGQIIESRVKEGELERKDVLDSYKSSIETGNAISRIEATLNTPEGQRAVGQFSKSGVAAAFGKILAEGIQAGNFGSVKFNGLEDAVRQAGGDQATIDAAQRLARDFAQMQLNIAKRDLKGQGAVSDNERAIVARVTGSTSNSPEVLKDFARWNRVRNTFDREVGDAYQKWDRANPNKQYSEFRNSDVYQNLEKAYIAKTDAMASKMGVTGAKAAPSDNKTKIDELKKKYATKKEST